MVDPRVDPDEMIERRPRANAGVAPMTPGELIEQIKALSMHAGIPIVVIVDKPAGQVEYTWVQQGAGAALDKILAVGKELRKMLMDLT